MGNYVIGVGNYVIARPLQVGNYVIAHNLSKHSVAELGAVAHALNGRPRKTLGWKTPAEALNDYLLVEQSSA